MVKFEKAVIVFAKAPEKGKVKTRLASTLGDDQALEIYQTLLRKTDDCVQQVEAKKIVYFTPHIPAAGFDPAIYEYRLQSDGDLGARMHQAFTEVLDSSDKVVIVGTDCPYLHPSHCYAAFDLIAKFDMVMGPTFDGGYYLLGLKMVPEGFFQAVPWSSGGEAKCQIQKALSSGLMVGLLSALGDIDHASDWEEYMRSLPT